MVAPLIDVVANYKGPDLYVPPSPSIFFFGRGAAEFLVTILDIDHKRWLINFHVLQVHLVSQLFGVVFFTRYRDDNCREVRNKKRHFTVRYLPPPLLMRTYNDVPW
jgi:hypothetical protein